MSAEFTSPLPAKSAPRLIPCEYKKFGCAAMVTKDTLDRHLRDDAQVHVSLLKAKFAVENAEKEFHLEALHHAQTRCREKSKENAVLRQEIEVLMKELLALKKSLEGKVLKPASDDCEKVRRMLGSLLPSMTGETMLIAKQSEEINRLRNEISRIEKSLSNKRRVAHSLRAQQETTEPSRWLEELFAINSNFLQLPPHLPSTTTTTRPVMGRFPKRRGEGGLFSSADVDDDEGVEDEESSVDHEDESSSLSSTSSPLSFRSQQREGEEIKENNGEESPQSDEDNKEQPSDSDNDEVTESMIEDLKRRQFLLRYQKSFLTSPSCSTSTANSKKSSPYDEEFLKTKEQEYKKTLKETETLIEEISGRLDRMEQRALQSQQEEQQQEQQKPRALPLTQRLLNRVLPRSKSIGSQEDSS